MDDGDKRAGRDFPLIQRFIARRFTGAQLVAIDAALVALILVVFEVFMSRQPARVSGTAWAAAGWTAYLVAAEATLFRRRWPRSTLAVVFPIAVAALALRAGGPIVFYVALALYCVVAVSSRRSALALTGIVVGGVLAALIVGHGDQLAQAAIGGVALLLLGWLAGEYTRASRVYAAQQAEQAREKAAATEAEQAARIRRAMADERAQIARELHDIVAHAMSVIAVRSGVARMVIDTDLEQAREALAIIETTTRRSLHEMRLLVGVLRDARADPAELSPVPGLRDLGRLVATAAAAGVSADVQIEGTVRSLSSSAELSAYRIVQEALTNVARHAGPTRARVRIGYQPHEVTIEVADDGPRGPAPAPAPVPASAPHSPAGHSPAGYLSPGHSSPGHPSPGHGGSGHGLIGMRERAALFGGQLAAGPRGSGFQVRATLPMASPPGGDPAEDEPGAGAGAGAGAGDRDRDRVGVPAHDGAR
jgi:signal transduction histidine kinase